jgi:hypothetical protein
MAAPESKGAQEEANHPYQDEYQKNNESNGLPILSSPPFSQLDIPVWQRVLFHCIVLEKNKMLSIYQVKPDAFDVAQT